MNVMEALLIGFGIGIISGIVGIGGGALLVPLLVYVYHMTQHRAQGTSLAMLLLPSGLLAFWKYYQAGNADLKMGLIMACGLFVGGYFGGGLAQHLSDNTLRRVFAVFLAFVAVRMFFQK
jgi:uncharacterized membrane protein YfcA